MPEAGNEKLEHRALLVCENDVISAGLTIVLEKATGLKIIKAIRNTKDCLATIPKVMPDLLITDDALPRVDALLITQTAKSLLMSIKVMIFATMTEDSRLLALLAAGINAYCLSSSTPSKLVNATEAVLKGAFWLDEDITTTIRNLAVLAGETAAEKSSVDIAGLSNRELEVLSLMALGQKNHQIGQDLGISPETVKTHVKNIMRKLAVRDRTQAAVAALKRQIVS